MKRHILVLGITCTLACALAALAFAQAPPQTKPPVAPKAVEQNSPDNCANATVGQGSDIDGKREPAQDKNLSDKLAASNGVICPPPHVDPAMRQPAPPGGPMPVIPPPGTPGGDPQVQPK
jgi:hypothetical protein